MARKKRVPFKLPNVVKPKDPTRFTLKNFIRPVRYREPSLPPDIALQREIAVDRQRHDIEERERRREFNREFARVEQRLIEEQQQYNLRHEQVEQARMGRIFEQPVTGARPEDMFGRQLEPPRKGRYRIELPSGSPQSEKEQHKIALENFLHNFHGMLTERRRDFPSDAAMARHYRVNPSTLRGWLRGAKPRQITKVGGKEVGEKFPGASAVRITKKEPRQR